MNPVKKLLDEGEDINKRDEQGWTVVMIAAGEGQLDVVNLLIKRGADLNLVNEKHFGMTALMLAAKFGHKTIVRILVKARADKYAKDSRGMTAFCYAWDRKHLEVLEYVLYEGVNVNTKDEFGNTPLLSSCKEGRSQHFFKKRAAGFFGRPPVNGHTDQDHDSGKIFSVLNLIEIKVNWLHDRRLS